MYNIEINTCKYCCRILSYRYRVLISRLATGIAWSALQSPVKDRLPSNIIKHQMKKGCMFKYNDLQSRLKYMLYSLRMVLYSIKTEQAN